MGPPDVGSAPADFSISPSVVVGNGCQPSEHSDGAPDVRGIELHDTGFLVCGIRQADRGGAEGRRGADAQPPLGPQGSATADKHAGVYTVNFDYASNSAGKSMIERAILNRRWP